MSFLFCHALPNTWWIITPPSLSLSLSLFPSLVVRLSSCLRPVCLFFPPSISPPCRLFHHLLVLSVSQLAPSVRTTPLLLLSRRSSSACGCKQDKRGNIGGSRKAKGNKSRARAHRAKRLSENQCWLHIKWELTSVRIWTHCSQALLLSCSERKMASRFAS